MRYSDVEKYPNEWLNTITQEDIENNNFPVIIDRDQTDVDRIERMSAKGWRHFTEAEKQWWYGVVKGSYKAEDMNRVQWAMAYIAELLRASGISVALQTEGKTWPDNSSLQDADAQTQAYLDDISTLRSALTMPAATPEVPDNLVIFGTDEANAIEKILLDLDNLIRKMPAAYRHSGVTVCGMGGLFL